MSTYIKADQFYYPHGVRRGGYLELVDGKFGKHVESLPEGADVLDYSGYSIAPGLVDTHIHGFGGVDVMDNNIEGTLHTMSEGLLSTGVTSFLPTTLTSSYEQLLAVTAVDHCACPFEEGNLYDRRGNSSPRSTPYRIWTIDG